jgi:hypothetical protein
MAALAGKIMRRAIKVPKRAVQFALSGDFRALERELMKNAIQRGIPGNLVGATIRFRRIIVSPIKYMRNKMEARRISASSPFGGFIDVRDGYRLFSKDDLPGVVGVLSATSRLFEQKGQPQKLSSKPFLMNMCDEKDLLDNPELLDFAKSQAVFEIAADYLKSVPRLSAIGVFYSPPNDLLEKSQLWHVDDEDFSQLKCFINLHEVRYESGPFTFIPAAKSNEIRRKLGHGWRGRRLEDAEVLAHCSSEDIISVTGAPGSGAFVDTSRCLHFGSRSRGGARLVMMFQYTRIPDMDFIASDWKRKGSILLTDH